MNDVRERAARTSLKPPSPRQIYEARTRAGLSQTTAVELVHLGRFSVWSRYENGHSPMDLARWELFLLKTAQHPTHRMVPL